MRIPLIVLAVLALGGFVAAAPLSSPPTVTIAPPAADLPAEVAALSGIWAGTWGGGLPTRLAVEELTRDSAVVVYAWGDHPIVHCSRGLDPPPRPGAPRWHAPMGRPIEHDERTCHLHLHPYQGPWAPLWGAVLP